MKPSLAIVAAFAPIALAAIHPKNLILILPDGLAPDSITLARSYLSSRQQDSQPDAPSINEIAIDKTTPGISLKRTQTQPSPDAAAASTALATSFTTENGAVSVLPNGRPVGSILEAAKLKGMLTALVTTSKVNHATPAAYSSHVNDRSALSFIAEQQVGYSHPLGQSIDVLLGGGSCYFKPRTDASSCREDNLDLLEYAAANGYSVLHDGARLEEQEPIPVPFIGLFHHDAFSYEVDRQQQQEPESEPSLTAMTKAALASLQHATEESETGYFIIIESSRLGSAAAFHDIGAHLHEVLQYNQVMEFITTWIDTHPDTAMLSVVDHKTGISLPTTSHQNALQDITHSLDYLQRLYHDYDGNHWESFVLDYIFPAYGVEDPTDEEIDALMQGDHFVASLAEALRSRSGISWAKDSRNAALSTTVYSYAAGGMGEQLRADLEGLSRETDLPRYIEEALGVSLDEVTWLLRQIEAKATPREL